MFFSRIAVPLALSMVAFGLVESFANRRTDLDVDTTAGRALLEQAGQGITYQPGVLSETEDENGLILSKGMSIVWCPRNLWCTNLQHSTRTSVCFPLLYGVYTL